MRITSIVVAGLLALTPATAGAQGSGIPTFDVAAYTQSLQEIARLQELISKTEQELSALNKQIDHLTGPRDMGKILQGAMYEGMIYYAPSSWEEYQNMLNEGYNPASAYDLHAYYKANAEKFKLPSNETLSPGGSNTRSTLAYGHLRDSTVASMSLSQAAYDANNQRFQNYQTLIGEIDSASDIKAAQDLGNRIAAENGMTQAELIRLLATNIQLQASESNQNLAHEAANAQMSRVSFE